MMIRNEYTQTNVFWRMFEPTDSSFWFGVGEGTVGPGANIGPLSHASGRFKLELKENGLFGAFLSSAGPVYNTGDVYVLRSDGRLERDVPAPSPLPLPTFIRRVNGFDIGVNSLPFRNSYPTTSFPVQEIAGFPITARAFGLCGGMAYATRDYFETGMLPPGDSNTPLGGPLFDYLWRRLLDSLNLPFGRGNPAHYLLLMSPALADAGPPTVLGVLSRAAEMINVEWPRIRDTIDSDRLCPIALVYHKTADSSQVFNNHQVIVYGYEIRESFVTFLINDPNYPRAEQRLTIDTADVNVHAVSYTGPRVWAFFTTDYVFSPPPQVPAHAWDSGWRSVGRIIASDPELLSMNPDNLAIFGRGIEGALWWTETVGTVWGPWQSLGGVITSAPGGVSWGNGRMDIFARGTDGSLQHTWRDNGNWSGVWESLGGVIVGGPDACSWGPGRLDVFARGTDDALWHIWYDNGWSGWESLGGQLASDPTAVSWGNGRIDVFVRGTDLRLHHRWFDGTWFDWEPLGGVLSSSPDVASWGPERLDIFARGTDGALWTVCFDGTWQPWTRLGGLIVSSPSGIALEPNRIAVVATGRDLGLWIKNYS